MASFGHIAGGLLSGLGEGMQLSGLEKRRMALEELRQQRMMERQEHAIGARREEASTERGYRSQEASTEREFKAGEAEKTREHQTGIAEIKAEATRGLLNRTVTDESGKVWGVTPTGEKIDLNITTAKPGTKGKKLSAKQAVDTAIDINTQIDPNTGLEDVDWKGVASYLEQKGFAEEASSVRQRVASAGREEQMTEARTQAEREAEERKSFWKPRSSEFAETGGDPDAWIEQRTQEIMGGDSGRQRAEPTVPVGEQPDPKGGGRTVEAGDIPMAPVDPEQREVGKKYRSPATGQIAVWTGHGWRPVQ